MLKRLKSLIEKEPESAKKKHDYKIKSKLGSGSYGVVNEAVHVPTGVSYAVKTILKKPLETNHTLHRLVHSELGILTGLDHPNIIKLKEWFQTKDKYYLVFELATGGELFERISARGKFTERDAAKIIYSVLDGLAFLHSHNIVHRDLKPENLLYKDESDDSQLMIADFGVANVVDDSHLLNTMCGSPGYAAPEVLKRVGHNKPADIWSVGIIAYTCLCGFHPFHYAEGVSELLEAICKAAYKFDSPYWDDISDDAKSFITTLLQIDPAKRPTAKQAMLHTWILTYIPEARAFAKTLRSKDTVHSDVNLTCKETQLSESAMLNHLPRLTVANDDTPLCLTLSQEKIINKPSHEFQRASNELVDLSSKWEQKENGPKMDLTKARRALRRVLTAASLIAKLKRASIESLKGSVNINKIEL